MLLPTPTSCYQRIDKRQVTSQLVPFIPKVLPSPPFPLARGMSQFRAWMKRTFLLLFLLPPALRSWNSFPGRALR